MNNKVRLEVCGSKYVISTPEEEGYVKDLALEIDKQVKACMEGNSAITTNDALVLTILSYADMYHKSEQNADHIRSQLTEYLEDAARARNEVDDLRQEIARLNGELKLYRSR